MPTPTEKLSYSELVNILCILAVRLEHTENALLSFLEINTERDDFLIHEILKARLDLIREDTKTPFKRLLELEDKVAIMEGGIHGIYEGRELKSSGRL